MPRARIAQDPRRALTPVERATLGARLGELHAQLLELERAAFYHRSTRPVFDALLRSLRTLTEDRDAWRRTARSLRHRRAPEPDYTSLAEVAVIALAGPKEKWKPDGIEHRAVNAILAAWAEVRERRKLA